MLERLSKHSHFCYLDGYSGFSQILDDKDDQEKTTFKCPFGNLIVGECHSVYVMLLVLYKNAFECYIRWLSRESYENIDGWFFCVSSFDNCLFNLNEVLKRC
jgi:hypothetical protein